jgi:hypothetical protein
MDSGRSTRALPRVGFPIRISPDQRMVSSFPGLIAAAHVLHRLLAPRHPPCALRLLTRKNTFYCRYGVFKVHVRPGSIPLRRPTRQRTAPAARSLKTQQRGNSRSTLFQASSNTGRRSRGAASTGRTPTEVGASVFPRKEVIQPQLPLRLPCYDFTPIINPTFDGCLPEGLAHRLRVLPTFVV